MAYLLGVDGGNSKTLALVARSDGTVVGSGRSGCGDIYATPTAEDAFAAVSAAADGALDAASVRHTELVAAGFSMAGADWPEDMRFLQDSFAQRGLGRTLVVVNDAIGALRVAVPDEPGVVVVCGTGMAIGARGADGHIWHTSFWQEPQGGNHLAQQALRAVYRAELGIDPPTTLSKRILAIFDLPTVEEVLHTLTAWRHPPLPQATLGALTRALLDEATHGDHAASRIVQQHGAAVGDYALAAARRVGVLAQPFSLALTGGVLRHTGPLLATTIVERVQSVAPQAQPIVSRFEPVVGALLLAFDTAGIAVDASVVERLRATLPPPVFFAT